MKARSAQQVLDKIGNPHLDLHRGEGYWYFVYDDGDKKFESRSVYTMYLNSLDLESWVEEGKALVKQMEDDEG